VVVVYHIRPRVDSEAPPSPRHEPHLGGVGSGLLSTCTGSSQDGWVGGLGWVGGRPSLFEFIPCLKFEHWVEERHLSISVRVGVRAR